MKQRLTPVCLHKKISRVWLYIALSLTFTFVFVPSAYPGDTELILTVDLTEKKPTELFDCGEKVHLYALLRDIPVGTHEAMAEWFSPKGSLQEVSEHKFVTKGENYALWLWLELYPDTMGDLLGSVSPSLGMEEFIGRWKVRFYLDDEFVVEKVFFVIC